MTSQDALDRVLVIIPTFNEAQNIESITNRLRRSVPDADILIADDNSPDGTGKLADRLASEALVAVHAYLSGMPAMKAEGIGR